MRSAPAPTGTLEEGQVRAMFDRIAGFYDVMNSVMTAGLHHRWRERAADLAQVGPGSRALDVATGTGDLALELARRVRPGGEVVGSDFSEGMLERARTKAGGEPGVRWEWGNALELPYADDEFDAATVGFGARNFSDLERGLAEMARVVRPGGRVVVLEITTPTRPPLSTFFSIWFDRIVPTLGRFAADPEAYTYLPKSVKRFPGPEPLGGALARAGLTDVRWILTAGGIIALHHGTVALMASAESVAAVIEAGGAHVPGMLERLEARLAEVAASHGPVLGEHAGATISAGGKRLRPLLVFVAAGPPADGVGAGLLRAAVAVELIHSATLVHDDVLDGAHLRRGRPTVVAVAGRGMATATGDLLFSRAFSELAANGSPQQIRVLSSASSALAEGELMQRADAWNAATTRERYLARCDLKTARLFQAACELGALEGGGPVELLGRFGRRIGLAFQLLDDVLDVSGPAARTGKHRGTDLLDGTVTLPLILARERDPELARVELREIRTPEQAEALCDAIAATGALEAARADAMEMVAEAKADLPALPDAQRGALELVADGVVDRYS